MAINNTKLHQAKLASVHKLNIFLAEVVKFEQLQSLVDRGLVL